MNAPLSPSLEDSLNLLIDDLRHSAVARDRAGGHAAQEKERIRQAGLLRLSVPVEYGGAGLPWHEIYRAVRRVATVDSALAHLLAFHHLQVATVLVYGSAEQRRRWLTRTVEEGGWWGNALNPRDARLTATAVEGGYRLDGAKGFCSGTRGSRFMTLSARHADTGGVLLGMVETQQHGITVNEDWDPIGQRQTDSGSVHFANVLLRREDVLREHDATPTAAHTLRNCFAQLVLVNIYTGIAIGALEEARAYLHREGQPWVASSAERASEDPYTLRRAGDLHAQISAATVLADRAALAVQASLARGERLTAQERGETAIAVAEAKVMAHRAGLQASQELFDLVGARGTRASLGYDRFWRNVRTHTLHDPLDYKLNALGRWALNGELPSPEMYN
jgi:alkylation response protein AidB-like acyl-CoA dehydrogenase